MAKKVIKFTLDEKDIDRAIKEVRQFEREFREKCNRLIEALTDEGVEIAKVQVAQLDAVFTGELMNSIEGYYSPESGIAIIKAGAMYATAVEFGTGVVGASSPHPNPQGWQYDSHSHGDEGWVYYDDDSGKFRWTKGFKSRPFMFNTARELERICKRIAEEVFGK